MDCIKHGKAKQTLQSTKKKKITGFYFTAVYLFILGICFLSLFLEEIKSHFPFLNVLSAFLFLAVSNSNIRGLKESL